MALLAQQATVITPNRRLALYLKREFDQAQLTARRSVWQTADILPWGAWLERCYLEAETRLAPRETLPVLLTPLQEQALWERVISESEQGAALLQVAKTAQLCREAWQLAHDWNLAGEIGMSAANEDVRAFRAWCARYLKLCDAQHCCDSARLAGSVTSIVGKHAIWFPRRLILAGFDVLTPAQRSLADELRKRGCEVRIASQPLRAGRALRLRLTAATDEILASAHWARARLEANPRCRIGVVVPDLARLRSAVIRAFSEVMQPASRVAGAPVPVRPFNVSLGLRLAGYPLVASALAILGLAKGEIGFNELGALLRSPFLAGAETELARRALLEARLRELGERKVTLERVERLARETATAGQKSGCPILALRLKQIGELRASRLQGAKPASQWAGVFFDALKLAGFPGERTLASAEYQTLRRIRELIASLATLDRISTRLRYEDALTRLRRMAAEALFQPETPDVPIQILGILEAAGLEFDHLWVMGLSSEDWPETARPNPFLPIELQRRHGLPHASSEQELEFAKRLTRGWLGAADEMVLSHPQRDQDRELSASPLIAGVPEVDVTALRVPHSPSCADVIHSASRLEWLFDHRGPKLSPSAEIFGGTSVLRDQAACPFRAFAVHRLDAAGLESPREGLDAKERGALVHGVLASFWQEIKTKNRLEALSETELGRILNAAAAQAVAKLKRRRPQTLSGKFAGLETARLVKLARAWLDIERERGDFEVVACEEKRAVNFGGMTISARLDRMDLLADGGKVILDYKTGEANVSSWLGPRPDEPQLPIYCAGAGEDVAAVAFARVKLGKLGFAGLAKGDGLLPGATTVAENRKAREYGSWDALLKAWREELERLGAEFAQGHAAVDPKRYPDTCRYCDIKPLCRIYELVSREMIESAAEENDG